MGIKLAIMQTKPEIKYDGPLFSNKENQKNKNINTFEGLFIAFNKLFRLLMTCFPNPNREGSNGYNATNHESYYELFRPSS